ncbi:MAG: putative porin [Chthoniobacter sp.]|uniref:putative porin n=1 Tax=Chthoniobacter sp. TaxID=2510640 RepID=UPI0032A621C5
MTLKPSHHSTGLRRSPSGFGLALVAAALATTASFSLAQDSGVLIDKLVQKGILSSKDAAEVRADIQKDAVQSPLNKISLSNSVTQLKLYGDFRLRYQYNDSEAQIADAAHVNQQSRFRYRLRLNADVQLGEDWFAGVQLQTGQTADSGNQTYSAGFNNDSIFISRAFFGWQNDYLKVVVGKQANPFYTTDLVWDPDINPAGFTETLALHKIPLFGGSGGPDGKEAQVTVAPSKSSSWEAALVAGQFIFGDNNEFSNTGDLSSDPWIFDEQLIVKYNFNKDTSVTIAPGFLSESAAHITGALNTLAFSDENAIVTGTTAVQTTVQEVDNVVISYNAAGVPTKTITPLTTTTTTQKTITPNNTTSGSATVSGPRTITSNASSSRNGGVITLTGKASGLATDPSKANQTFTTTATSQNQTVSTTNNVGLPGITGETRGLHLLTVPGDISFKLAGIKSKLYWDVSYNVSGRNRFDNVLQLKDFGSREYQTRDGLAWLVGVQFGETRKKGDWQAYLNYREVGIAAVDPNLNDSDFAQSTLNVRGFKVGLAYALTDFVVINAAGYVTWNLEDNLYGGRATSVGGIAPYNAANIFTLDVNVKF